MSSWFEFNLNINNILVALTAVSSRWDIAPLIVGDTEVCEALRTSSARDFGLYGEVDYLEQLVKISETDGTGGPGEETGQLAVELDGGCYFLRLFHRGTSVCFPAEAGND